jgi:hypothetical protein
VLTWEPKTNATFSRHAQRFWAEACAEEHALGHYIMPCALSRWVGYRGLNLFPGPLAATLLNQVWVGSIIYLPLAGAGVPSHLASYLLAARGGLAPRPRDVHRTRAQYAGVCVDTVSTSFIHADRLWQSLHQLSMPGAYHKSQGAG